MGQLDKYYLVFRIKQAGSVRVVTEHGGLYERSGLHDFSDPIVQLKNLFNLSIAASTIPGYYLVKTANDFVSSLSFLKVIELNFINLPFRRYKAEKTCVVFDDFEKWDNEGLPIDKRYQFKTISGWLDSDKDLEDNFSLSTAIEFGEAAKGTDGESFDDWWLKILNYPKSEWRYDRSDSPQVTIIERGIEANHSVFVDSWMNQFAYSSSEVRSKIQRLCQEGKLVKNFTSDGSYLCSSSHGTAVASVICGKKNRYSPPDKSLISLVPGLPLSVVNGLHSSVDQGPFLSSLTHAAESGSHLINVSAHVDWSVGFLVEFLRHYRHISVVAATGNGKENFDLTGNNRGFDLSPNLFSVTALDSNGYVRSDANRGSVVSFAMPGREIPVATTSNGISYRGEQTSIATALMTGVFARTISVDFENFANKPQSLKAHFNSHSNKVYFVNNTFNTNRPVKLNQPINIPDLSFFDQSDKS